MGFRGTTLRVLAEAEAAAEALLVLVEAEAAAEALLVSAEAAVAAEARREAGDEALRVLVEAEATEPRGISTKLRNTSSTATAILSRNERL